VKFIDLFAGIGGFRLGMEMAGHECVGHCEIDNFAQRSYKAMHEPKEDEWFATDIRRVTPEELPEADCCCGGFPCQSFSVAGKRGGFKDTRGTLFFEIMRLAAVRKPKYLFLENVPGLLSHNGGKTFGTIINTMGELGYDAEWQVLNSKDFGVPQNRERVFIIGHLRGKSRPKVFPITGTSTKNLKELTQGLADTYRVYDGNELARTIKAEAGGMGAKTGLYEVKACLTPDRLNKRQDGRRFKEDEEPMFTLTSQDRHGIAIQSKSDIKIRRLTPKECFRLQGFPDEYFDRARKVNSDNQLYKQAGNSVTVNVVYEIAKRLD
jgi:DNA (cytosine-5)-methyltransferase 1